MVCCKSGSLKVHGRCSKTPCMSSCRRVLRAADTSFYHCILQQTAHSWLLELNHPTIVHNTSQTGSLITGFTDHGSMICYIVYTISSAQSTISQSQIHKCGCVNKTAAALSRSYLYNVTSGHTEKRTLSITQLDPGLVATRRIAATQS